MNKINCTLTKWKQHDLTLRGKAVIVNTLFGNSLNYFGKVVSCSEDWIKKIEQIIFGFLWSKKSEKIKRDTVTGPGNLGGTGLIDVKNKLSCLKLMWLSHYIKSEGKWKSFFNYWIEKAGESSRMGWYVFNKSNKRSLQTTSFYKDLLISFDKAGAFFQPDSSTL